MGKSAVLAVCWQIEYLPTRRITPSLLTLLYHRRGKHAENPDVLTIEDELASCAEKLKWDKEAIAAFPHLLERLSQYVKNRGPKWRWCLNCYITKKPVSLLEPWLPVGPNEEQRALYKCGKCGRTYEAHR